MTRRLALALALAVIGLGCGTPSSPAPANAAVVHDSYELRPRPEAPAGSTARAPARVPHKGPVPENTCFVDFLDVGAGLSVLIRCKDGSGHTLNILFDAGSNEDKLRNTYRTLYLLEHGLGFAPGSTIHHLFQSHPHYDHHSDLGTAKGIIEKYKVKHVWDPAMYYATEAYRCFLHSITKTQKTTDLVYHPATKCPTTRKLECGGDPVGYFQQDQVEPYKAPSITRATTAPYEVPFGFTGVKGQILYSDPDAEHPNDAALVLKLQLHGVEILLAADEEAGDRAAPSNPPDAGSVEEFLIAPARKHLLRAHIIQVPHHGSLTSSRNAFKDAAIWRNGSTADTWAVVSSGAKDYGSRKRPDGTMTPPRVLPDKEQMQSWRAKLGAGKLLSTTTDDKACADKDPRKIAPDPPNDVSVAGCTSVEFKIERDSPRGKIKSIIYWPAGPEVL